jgi:hypothetical protein
MIENNIENYYKDIDKPTINNLINNNNFKNLLELSIITDLYIFKKKTENCWKLKDKRQLLKECDNKKKYKIKEVTNTLNHLSKKKVPNVINVINEIKLNNNNLISELEKIDSLIDTIQKSYPDKNIFIESYSN